MAFDTVIGQSRVKKIITAAIQGERLAHAYLFHGPPGIGKDAMAIRLAMGLNCLEHNIQGCGACSHCRQVQRMEFPSFRFVLPVPTRPQSMSQEKYMNLVREKTIERIENPYQNISFAPVISSLPGIGIEPIRSLKKEVILKQQGGHYRIFIISHAESMTIPAANSLLKLLEEPPSGTLLFLTTSAPNRILPTIASRCQNIRFDILSNQEVEQALIERWKFDQDNAHFFSHMSNGSIQRALELNNKNFEALRTSAWSFLTLSFQGNHLKRMAECDTLIQSLDKTGIHSMLQLLLAWFRDLLCLKTGNSDKMINLDRETLLENFLKQFDDINLEMALSETEHAIASLQKNVYLNLIVHALSQKLNQLAKERHSG